jgi:iron complex outermembrane receptor protein
MTRSIKRIGELILSAFVLGGSCWHQAIAQGADQDMADRGEDVEPIVLSPLVVTATRVGIDPFDLPMAIDGLDAAAIQGQGPGILVSEVLARVPGTVVSNRGTFAQEEQMMIRGFGSRAQFGTRGVKLLADGIPAGTPDGQGGPGLFGLGSARDIEVMRGAFSALYGNHSGGVVQVFTEEGPPDPTLSLRLIGGSDSTWLSGMKLGGQQDAVNYVLDAYSAETDGYRDWSRARKEQINAKLRLDLENGGTISLIANLLNQPENLDPLGLTAAQVAADRRQAQPAALDFQSRRTLDNLQGGILYDQPLTDRDSIQAMAYTGTRSNEQFLAIPLFAQNAITASGGVSAFDRSFFGGRLWWNHETSLADGPLSLTLGTDFDRSTDQRKGYLNELGTRTALKRDEDNRVTSWGAFMQGKWQLATRWSLDPGLRYTRVEFDSTDRFICTLDRVTAPGAHPGTCSGSSASITATNLNPDDSGRRTYDAWTPALGLVHSLTPTANLYANVGRTFETPTFTELAYRPDGGTGLNLVLNPALSWHYEVGTKLRLGPETRLNLALFQIDTDDELTVATNQGGRASYQNAPSSRRQGAELLLEASLGQGFAGYLAATYLDARWTDDFFACTATPCRTISPQLSLSEVRSGNRIPGIPPFTLFGELSYAYEPWGLTAAVDLYGQGRVRVDDLNTESAGEYWSVGLRGGLRQRWGPLELSQLVRVDNLLDREYIGAIIVNDSNGRYYAPAAGMSYSIGMTLSYTFGAD